MFSKLQRKQDLWLEIESKQQQLYESSANILIKVQRYTLEKLKKCV